jgi:hypothetical protein
MSLNDLLDALFAEIAAPNNDDELFARYLNLNGYDYEYNLKNDPEPSSNPPTSVVTPPSPCPSEFPVVAHSNQPTEPRTAGPLTPVTPSSVLAAPVTCTSSVTSPFVGGGMDHLPPLHPIWPTPLAQGALHCSAPLAPCMPRPTGLGTNGAYWNIQAGACTPGWGNVDCTIGRGCMGTVSLHPQ